MSLFGTNDVIYVPEGGLLTFDDVYHWKRYKFDVHRFGVRIRPAGFEDVSARVNSTLKILKSSPRFAEIFTQVESNSQEILKELAGITGHIKGHFEATLAETVRDCEASWWVQLSDLPAETFFEEDYENPCKSTGDFTPHLTYGNVKISQLDGLDVPLIPAESAESEEKEQPLSIDVPEKGLTRWTLPPHEPLPLIHEFCGTRGASSKGRSINIDTNGKLAPDHQLCTPLGKIGNRLYVTLYFHTNGGECPDVLGPIPPKQLIPTAELLEKSDFVLKSEGPMHRIYDRDGDCVHLYSQLPGKESENVETMPPFLLVASASGQFDPLHRAELYDAIREAMKTNLGK